MIFWHFTYYFTFSFLSKQSEPFKAAFLGTTRDNEQSRFKRQLQSAEVDDTAIEDNAEIGEEGSTHPAQETEANSEQGEENVDTLLTAEGDDAINCNWNIKVNKICTFKIFYHRPSWQNNVASNGYPENVRWKPSTYFFQTESDLYLLVTFHNLSAPFTVECEGAYIEVERENNGFEARWCGNRVTQVMVTLFDLMFVQSQFIFVNWATL